MIRFEIIPTLPPSGKKMVQLNLTGQRCWHLKLGMIKWNGYSLVDSAFISKRLTPFLCLAWAAFFREGYSVLR